MCHAIRHVNLGKPLKLTKLKQLKVFCFFCIIDAYEKI